MRSTGRNRDVPGMSEQIGFVLVLSGLLLSTAGLLWLVARVVGLGLGGLGLRGLGLGRMAGRPSASRRRFLNPALLLAAGLVIGAVPFVSQRAYLAIHGLAERERIIDGERALTLTGWDRSDYSILATRPDVAILEMSNPDVTDETLAVLRNLPRLKELSLDDSAVTDRGLAVLAGLPALESLRVARTKITPDGVAAFLASPPPRLRQIDVSGNGIQAEILRAWKEAGGGDSPRGGRRYVN
jgi:hypothetical protein